MLGRFPRFGWWPKSSERALRRFSLDSDSKAFQSRCSILVFSVLTNDGRFFVYKGPLCPSLLIKLQDLALHDDSTTCLRIPSQRTFWAPLVRHLGLVRTFLLADVSSPQEPSAGLFSLSLKYGRVGAPRARKASLLGLCAYHVSRLCAILAVRVAHPESLRRFLWGISGPFLGVYTVVQNLNIPLIIQPHLFAFLCLTSWAQVGPPLF